MRRKRKKVEPIPSHFETYDAAGEFWDTHDTAGYPCDLEDTQVDLKGRRFEIENGGDVRDLLRKNR
jgi:predicted transcriptional regulator